MDRYQNNLRTTRAIFPEFIPRLWARNIGTETLSSGRTVEDLGHWFEREDRDTGNCIALKHLAEGDESWHALWGEAYEQQLAALPSPPSPSAEEELLAS